MINQDLFSDESLSKKSNFDQGKGERAKDGLYRVDLSKVSSDNKKRGYKARLRFLPNLTTKKEYLPAFMGSDYTEDAEGALGPSFYSKVTHYLNITKEELSHLRGFYDDPTNINPLTGKPFTTDNYGPLATLYFKLDGSNNSVMKEKAKMIRYQKKFFSYVLVIEDEQQPELEGRIMIFEYGKQIQSIIEDEKEGTIGDKCDIFSPYVGKDFILVAKENSFTDANTGKEVNAADYTKSKFVEVSPLKIRTKSGELKELPLNENGKFAPEHFQKFTEFLLDRDVELEDWAGKAWTEEQQAKVSEAIDYFTGKTPTMSVPKSKVEDFSFDAASDSPDFTDEDFNDSESTTKTVGADSDFGDLDFDDEF